MPTVELTIPVNQIPDLYASAVQLLGARRIHKAMADQGELVTKRHLRNLSNQRDHGSRFYAGFYDVTFSRSSETRAEVVIPPAVNKDGSPADSNPLAAHFWGATIRPSGDISAATGRPIQSLAIPVSESAKGHVPAEFDNLKLLLVGPVGNKRAVLAAMGGFGGASEQRPNQGKGASRKKGAQSRYGGILEVMFLLLKSVTLRPDPTVLPTNAEYANAGVTAVVNQLNKVRNREL